MSSAYPFFWGLGYPRIDPDRRAELQGALKGCPHGLRLAAGLSLLVSMVIVLIAVLTVTAPGLQAFEDWLGLPNAPHVVGTPRWLAIGAAGLLLVLALGFVWCAVTYAWAKVMRRLALLPELAIEAIARGAYLS